MLLHFRLNQHNTTYDALGHVSTVSNPYRSTNDPTYGITTYDYDALGRTNLVIPPDGTTNANNVATAYSGNCTTVTDQTGKSRKSCSDALGRLTGVWEDPGTSPHLNYETDYSYDVLDNLLTVVQNGARQRTFGYNSLSQLTSATNPESGAISYRYDNNGNVVTKTDARGITTCFGDWNGTTCNSTTGYDALNRGLKKTYSDATPSALFTYDTASLDGHTLTNPVGRLVKNATADGKTATWNGYDQMGRILNQWQCSPLNCGATPYSNSFAYDFLGDRTSETYSYTTGTLTISYAYDAAGRATQLTSSYVDSQHPATLVSGVTYSPAGAIAQLTYGNGLVETRSYNNRLQPAQMRTYNPSTGSDILNMSFGFNAGTANNGNVASWSATGQQTFNRTYTYDPLNRIASMSSPSDPTGCTGLSWTIDRWGNRTDQTVTGGTCNTFHQSVDANNRLFGSPYQYDSAGNMTHDPSHSYGFDAENRVTQVDGGSTASYIYDAIGRRVWKSVGGTTTDYLCDLSGNIFAEFGSNCPGICWKAGAVYLNGQFIAQYYNATTYFIHSDHLGSTRILTAMDKSIFDNMDYLPFGEQITGDTGSTLKFTGKERDGESGLDNFDFRYASSSLGRFTCPDPLGGYISNPQSLNRYTYVLNNPLNLVDPLGLQDFRAGTCLDENGSGIVCQELPPTAPDPSAMIPPPDPAPPPADLPSASGLPTGNPGAGSASSSASLNATQLGLGLLGGIPGPIGTGANLINAGISFYRGQYGQGALNLVFAIPFAGTIGEIGRVGELGAGIIKNTERVESLTRTAAFRVPDELNAAEKIIGEVKNVNYQAYTRQLKDSVAYAQKYGYQFRLYVRQGTRLSAPLLDAVEDGLVNLVRNLP